jgi:hypothetical protein
VNSEAGLIPTQENFLEEREDIQHAEPGSAKKTKVKL